MRKTNNTQPEFLANRFTMSQNQAEAIFGGASAATVPLSQAVGMVANLATEALATVDMLQAAIVRGDSQEVGRVLAQRSVNHLTDKHALASLIADSVALDKQNRSDVWRSRLVGTTDVTVLKPQR